MSDIKKQLIEEMNQRVHDKILERTKADLLIKLITNADDDNEALSIAAMGTTYKRTGLHFDYRNEKMSNEILVIIFFQLLTLKRTKGSVLGLMMKSLSTSLLLVTIMRLFKTY